MLRDVANTNTFPDYLNQVIRALADTLRIGSVTISNLELSESQIKRHVSSDHVLWLQLNCACYIAVATNF